MIKCGKCQSICKDTDILCGNCGASKNEFIRGGESSKSQNMSLSKSQNNYNSKIKLSDNESIIKSYNAASMNGIFAAPVDGYITVTNKRVIFQSESNTSFYRSEVPIEDVSGTRIYNGVGWDILSMVKCGILSIISLFFFNIWLKSMDYYYTSSTANISAVIGLVVGAIAIYMGCRSYNQSYNISIYSKGASSSPISIGDHTFGFGLTGQGAACTITAVPSVDTKVMIEELGALILDIKTLGDHAIDKWSNDKKTETKFNEDKNIELNNSNENKDEFTF